MLNAEIEFEVRINTGEHKGQVVHVKTDVEELEEEDLSSLLIRDKHLKCWCNQNEYTVINRHIILTSN